MNPLHAENLLQLACGMDRMKIAACVWSVSAGFQHHGQSHQCNALPEGYIHVPLASTDSPRAQVSTTTVSPEQATIKSNAQGHLSKVNPCCHSDLSVAPPYLEYALMASLDHVEQEANSVEFSFTTE